MHIVIYCFVVLALVTYPIAAFYAGVSSVVSRVVSTGVVCKVFKSTYVIPTVGLCVFVMLSIQILSYIQSHDKVYAFIANEADYKVVLTFFIFFPALAVWSYRNFLSFFSRVLVLSDRIVYITLSPARKIISVASTEIVDVKIDKFAIAFLFDNSVRVLTSGKELKLNNVGKLHECVGAIKLMRTGVLI